MFLNIFLFCLKGYSETIKQSTITANIVLLSANQIADITANIILLSANQIADITANIVLLSVNQIADIFSC